MPSDGRLLLKRLELPLVVVDLLAQAIDLPKGGVERLLLEPHALPELVAELGKVGGRSGRDRIVAEQTERPPEAANTPPLRPSAG
ncbi:MAG: hypothetical protein KIG15_01425 [Coriobacteriales bacterium]|nr:hypothetical protein [Coriobacteriales bacterium]